MGRLQFKNGLTNHTWRIMEVCDCYYPSSKWDDNFQFPMDHDFSRELNTQHHPTSCQSVRFGMVFCMAE